MFEIVFGVAGGLAIFLFGMSLCSEGLQRASGSALKAIIHKLTSNPVYGVVVGAMVTVLIQSSSATTVILVGLVGASLMTLKQSIGVILGADIGTTLTVQLIAFKVTSYSLLIIAIGFGIKLMAKKAQRKFIGQIIMGFGFIFFGMHIMSSTMEPLKNYPAAQELFLSFGTNPLLGLLVATLFTAVIQGSAATIGIVLSLSLQGLIPLESAIPLILGANVGTCATALLATIGASNEAKRVGFAHVFIKLLGVALIFPFIGPFTAIIQTTAVNTARQIANAHTLFNVGITVLFLPFASRIAKIVEFLVPDRGSPAKALGRPVFLEKRSLDTPVLALEQARSEVLRVARMIDQMVHNVGRLLEHHGEQITEDTIKMEEAIDSLYKEIIAFLSDIAQHNLSEKESQENLLWIQVINDLEHIGDVIIRMCQMIVGKLGGGREFSPEGYKELCALQIKLNRLSSFMVAVLENPQEEQIDTMLSEAKGIVDFEHSLRISHIRRLQAQVAVSRDTSSIHLDLINGMRRVAEHVGLIGRNLSAFTSPNKQTDFDITGEHLIVSEAK